MQNVPRALFENLKKNPFLFTNLHEGIACNGRTVALLTWPPDMANVTCLTPAFDQERTHLASLLYRPCLILNLFYSNAFTCYVFNFLPWRK